MKVFLDDNIESTVHTFRNTPPGWVGVKTPEEAIELLAQGQVTCISLDHDLCLPEPRNGYAVVQWLEEQVAVHGFKPPIIWVHTANTSAEQKMLAGIQAIHRFANIPYTFHPVWEPGRDDPP